MSDPALIIGRHRYALTALSPQARGLCRQIEFCEQQQARLQRELALLQQIRAEAVLALPALLPGEAVIEPRVMKRRRYWPSAPACKPRQY